MKALIFFLGLFALVSAAQADDDATIYGGIALGLNSSGEPVLVPDKARSEKALHRTLLAKCGKQAKDCKVLDPVVNNGETGDFSLAAIAAKKNGQWKAVPGPDVQTASDFCRRHGDGECHPEFSAKVEENGFR